MFSIEERLLQYDKQGLFGKYHLDGTLQEAFLGSGSFGSVYRLSRVEIDSRGHEDLYTRAVKLIAIDAEHIRRARTIKEEDIPRQLMREKNKVDNEIRTMKKLGQENGIAFFFESRVIKRTDTPETSWDVLIIMEELEVLPKYLHKSAYVPGTAAYLKCALHVWWEISSSLHVCEIKQILHLDVKPDNIFHSAGDHYKLGDFGNAMEGAHFDEKILRGTHDYMAPEMYHRQGGDIRADIYSLAITIYEMLNGGRLPFQEDLSRKKTGGATSVREMRAAAVKTRLEELRTVQPIRGVPQDVNELLLRCLQKDPEKRCANCAELSQQTLTLYAKYCTGRRVRRGGGLKVVLGAAAAVGVLGLGAAVLALKSETSGDGGIPLETTAPAWAAETPVATAEEILLPTPVQTPRPIFTPRPTPIPTPEPTAVPEMRLEMKEDSVSADDGALKISGRVFCTGEMDAEKLDVSVNGNGVAADWIPVDGGYAFTAEIANMDLTDVDQLRIRIRLRGEEAVVPAEGTLPVMHSAAQTMPAEDEGHQTPIQADEAGESYFLGVGGALTLTGTAQPYSTIQVQINGRFAGNYAVGEDGRFGVDITDGLLLADQENVVTAAYRDSDEAVKWRIYYDTVAPVLECVSQIDQNTDGIDVQVSGVEGEPQVSLWVDGERTEISAATDETGLAHLAGLRSLQLTDASNIELRTADAAGNVGAAKLTFVRAMSEIQLGDYIRNGQVSGQAEPGAQVLVQMGDQTRTVEVGQDGLFMADFGLDFADGSFEVMATYASYQGAAVTETREITQTLLADSQPPQVQVQPEVLVNGAREISVSVDNEPGGWQAELFLNDERADIAVVQNEETVTLFIPEDWTLNEESKIRLSVRDACDNISEIELSYKDVEELTVKASYDAVNQQGDTLLRLRFKGEPRAMVVYVLNGQEDTVRLNAHGFASVRLNNAITEGENALTFRYGDQNGWPEAVTSASAQEISLTADTQAPEITVDTQRITPLTQTLTVNIQGEDQECTLEMLVNGICMMQTTAGQSAVLENVNQLNLQEGDEILLRATDQAGNVATLSLEYYEIDPLTVHPAGNAFELAGEPGASVQIYVNDVEVRVTLSDQGSGAFDATEYLREGENQISFAYAEENGFDPALVPEAPPTQTVWSDTTPPQIAVSIETITRDTGEITITVEGEDTPCMAALWVNGEVVLRGGGPKVITLRGLGSLKLKEGDDVRLVVTDESGNEATQTLTYENTSSRVQAWAQTSTEFLGTVSAGARLEIHIPLLCSQYDMKEGYVTLYLVDAAGDTTRITFDTSEMSPEEYAQWMNAQGESIDAGYVDAGYFLAGMMAKEHMPGGNYTLMLRVETEVAPWEFPLGSVSVERDQQTGSNYVDVENQYAVGFDAPIQQEFQAEQVLLSGWVCRQSGKEAYFDHYELLDANGNLILQGLFDNEEFAQYERTDVDAMAQGISGSVTAGAGFVLTPHWEALPDGEYTLQIYSSNTLGMAVPTASVCFRIQASAAPLAGDAAVTLTAGWVVPEQTEAPQ